MVEIMRFIGCWILVPGLLLIWVAAVVGLVYEGLVELHTWWTDRQQRKRREAQDLSRMLEHEVHGLDQEFIQAVNDLYQAAHRFRDQ